MEKEIKNMKKRETIMTVILVILILITAFIIIFVYSNKDEIKVTEQPQVIDKNTYVRLEEVTNDDYSTIYETVNLKKVTLINIPEILVSDFYEEQDEIIKSIEDNITKNKEYIDNYNKENNITNYELNSKIDSNIIYELKDNVLSVLYLVEDTVDYLGLNNHITKIYIDVSSNTLIDNKSFLEKFNVNKENVSLQILDRVINEHDGNFINKETKEELTQEEVSSNKNEYINLLIANFDTYIYPYLNNDSIYFKFNKNDISNFLFNEDLNTIGYSTLKM